MTDRRSTITVRGVDRELYEELVRLARETGRNIGDLVNVAMKLLLANVKAGIELIGKKVEEARQAVEQAAQEAEALVVEGVDELTVSRRDLLEAPKPVVFKGLRRLVFEDDVDAETFESKVKAIVAVDEVEVPEKVPKLLVASRCRLVKRISSRSP